VTAGIFAFTLAQNEFLYALIFLTRSDVLLGSIPVENVDARRAPPLQSDRPVGLTPGG